LALQSLLTLTIALEGDTDLGDLARWQGQNLGFAPPAVRESGRGVGFTLAATAIGFAAFAAQADEGAAQEGRDKK
jgi:hypothetical protein